MNKLNDISQKRFSQTTWFKQEYDIEVMHTLVHNKGQTKYGRSYEEATGDKCNKIL